METVERFEAVFRSWSGGTPYNFHHIGCSSKGDGPVNVYALCEAGCCPAPTQPWIPPSAVLRTQLCDATDPVWPGEDHATLDHLGLYGRAGCCQSPQGSSPNDEGTGLPPHLRARLALLPCHRPIFLPLDPHDVRSKGCKASCALEDEESVEPGVKHDRILVEGGPQGDLAKRLSRNQPCVESGIWTPAAKSRLT